MNSFEAMEFHTKIILHPTDFSDNSATALGAALDILSIPKTRLVIFHVNESPSVLGNHNSVDLEKTESEKNNLAKVEMEQYLKKCFGNQEPIPVPERVVVTHSSVYKGVLDYINKLGPYMVVIGQKGVSKLPHLLMGSTAKHIVEKANCPVLVVPSTISE